MPYPNLAGFNLNLLRVFEALFIERSVSRAARRIGLTQPSLSNTLSRLRILVHDDLFVRTPQGMRPTSRALELASPIEKALNQIRMALNAPERFDPSVTIRQFSIGASDNVDPAYHRASASLKAIGHWRGRGGGDGEALVDCFED